MNPSQLLHDGVDVLVLDLGWHAHNQTGLARSADQIHTMKSLCSGWSKPPPGWALIKYRLMGQRGPDHCAISCKDNITTRARLQELYGRPCVWLQRIAT